MQVFQELDKWAYDIEQEYKNGIVTPKRKRQYTNICAIRDRKYEEYLKEIEMKNRSSGIRYCPTFKWCKERMIPPKPPGTKLVKDGGLKRG